MTESAEKRWHRVAQHVIASELMPHGVALPLTDDQDWLISYLNDLEQKLETAAAKAALADSYWQQLSERRPSSWNWYEHQFVIRYDSLKEGGADGG